jgi:hypothetical protein
MRKLNNLQYLSYFVVGKHEDKGIKEMGTLSNLHGSFSIKKVENVTNNFEASEAKIMNKSTFRSYGCHGPKMQMTILQIRKVRWLYLASYSLPGT